MLPFKWGTGTDVSLISIKLLGVFLVKLKLAFFGGIFIAFGLLIGAIVGVAMDQASAGTVIGMAIGTSIAVLIWVMDRKRR